MEGYRLPAVVMEDEIIGRIWNYWQWLHLCHIQASDHETRARRCLKGWARAGGQQGQRARGCDDGTDEGRIMDRGMDRDMDMDLHGVRVLHCARPGLSIPAPDDRSDCCRGRVGVLRSLHTGPQYSYRTSSAVGG